MNIIHNGDNGDFQLDGGTLYNYAERTNKYKTYCCALGMLSLHNDNSLEFIQSVVQHLKDENNTPANIYGRNAHERAYIVMTTEDEEDLEVKLEAAGFKNITSIHRRNYVPEDSMLNMWIISW